MADYDIAAKLKPVLGTADDVLMDAASFTPGIDMFDWKSVIFIANINAPARYADVSWTVQDSDDNGTFAAAAAADVLEFKPLDQTTQSRVFHCGYRGKKRYVRAAFECDGTTAAVLSPTIGAAITLTSVTSSGTTATATKVGHGLVVGQYVTISGAAQTDYNGRFRITTVADPDTFTYTMLADPAVDTATGTITATPEDNWTNDEGADVPTSVTAGSAALTGTYTVTVSHITGGAAAAEYAIAPGNAGDGTVTIGTISAAGANAIFGETLRLVCTAESADAGTFTAYREDGSSLGTILVGGGPVTLQVGGVNAIQITIADGAADWEEDDRIDVRVTDLGVNRYILTAPDGSIVGYPRGGTAFSTGSHLTFTIPDSTVAVSDATASLPIVVTQGLAYGQITALLGNPMSGPVFSTALET